MPWMLIIALVLNVGVFAVWFAWRVRLPSIVVLLVLGSALGRWLAPQLPQAAMQSVLPVLLGSAVALIYCDGGRSLGGRPLGADGKLVGHLVGWGAKLGWIGISLLAHFVLGGDVTESLFLGALLMVSAPYMVDSVVARLGGDARMSLILRWDSYLLSCIGVAWAVLMLGALEAHQGEPKISKTIAITLLTAVVGVAVGYAGTLFVKFTRQGLPPWLRDPVAVALTFLCFGVAQSVYWGSGLVACISLGYLSSHSEDQARSDNFWESLRVLYIAVLGIYLGMMVSLQDLVSHWPQRLLFALLVVAGVRPLLAKIGARHGLTPRDHLLLSMTWPRGVLTLATAAMVSPRLQVLNPLAANLLPITYWVVMVSLLLPWCMGPWLLSRCAVQPGEQANDELMGDMLHR